MFSCTESRPVNTFFLGEYDNSKEIQFEQIELKKIVLDYTPEGGLYFIDRKSNKFDFDTTGECLLNAYNIKGADLNKKDYSEL